MCRLQTDCRPRQDLTAKLSATNAHNPQYPVMAAVTRRSNVLKTSQYEGTHLLLRDGMGRPHYTPNS